MRHHLRSRSNGRQWKTLLFNLVLAVFAGLIGFAVVTSASPGLISMLVFIGCWAVGLVFSFPFSTQFEVDPEEGTTDAGLSILAVLGGAAFIVWLGHALA